MKLPVLDIKGENTGREVELSNDIFGIEPNEHALYLDVKQYLANQRQGTHKAKEKGEIKGSTRKLRKQKGGGTARVGSIKSPVFRGGGRVFGPRPRDYRFKLNKNVKSLAKKSALSMRAKSNSIIVLEDFTFDKPKTKDFLSLVSALNLNDKKILFVFQGLDNNVYLSAKNLQKVSVSSAFSLNTYAILNSFKIVVLESALGTMQDVYSKK